MWQLNWIYFENVADKIDCSSEEIYEYEFFCSWNEPLIMMTWYFFKEWSNDNLDAVLVFYWLLQCYHMLSTMLFRTQRHLNILEFIIWIWKIAILTEIFQMILTQ